MYGPDIKMASGFVGGAPNAAPSPFDTVYNTLTAVNVLAARVELLAERLLGPSLQNGKTGTDAPKPTGYLPALAEQAGETGARIFDANEALSRIEAVLP